HLRDALMARGVAIRGTGRARHRRPIDVAELTRTTSVRPTESAAVSTNGVSNAVSSALSKPGGVVSSNMAEAPVSQASPAAGPISQVSSVRLLQSQPPGVQTGASASPFVLATIE